MQNGGAQAEALLATNGDDFQASTSQNSCYAQRPYNKRMLIMKRCVAYNKCSPKEFGRTSNERYVNEASAARSGLNALRKIYQPAINDEIYTILKRYAELYFKPAVGNICANVEGMNMDNLLHLVCRNSLEEAKKLFPVEHGEGLWKRTDRSVRLSNRTTHTPCNAPMRMIPCKREAAFFGMSQMEEPVAYYKEDDDTSLDDGDSVDGSLPSTAKRPKNRLLCDMIDSEKLARKWDPKRVKEDSLFVLGPQANSALGFSTQRGRIYTKYPWLFKYIGDNDDRQWLIDQKLKRGKNGGKVFFILFEDIQELAEICRDNPDVDLSPLQPFKLPPFILDKVRHAMVELFQHVKSECSADSLPLVQPTFE